MKSWENAGFQCCENAIVTHHSRKKDIVMGLFIEVLIHKDWVYIQELSI